MIGLAVAVGIGFAYFRDLGDASQMFLRVKRKNMIRFIRHEYQLLAIGLGAAVLMMLSYFLFDGGTGWLFWPSLLSVIVFYGFPWVYTFRIAKSDAYREILWHRPSQRIR